ncbi:MAG: DUF4258 domain-containing protein [Nitrospinae bacterium]|nr:DUF4258 domain-containing protein [Nitrospinota bacterium]
MEEIDATDLQGVLRRILAQVEAENIRITQHSHQEMVEEGITIDELLEAIAVGQILENYPEHRRGACCLLYGLSRGDRPIHIVCTTAQPAFIIITAYEPKPPRWMTPTQREREK